MNFSYSGGVNSSACSMVHGHSLGNFECPYPVSTKHLPRYLREWSYRFNRRGRIDALDMFLLRRAVGRATITYAELVAGMKVAGPT